jgi:hypothetical protein
VFLDAQKRERKITFWRSSDGKQVCVFTRFLNAKKARHYGSFGDEEPRNKMHPVHNIVTASGVSIKKPHSEVPLSYFTFLFQ